MAAKTKVSNDVNNDINNENNIPATEDNNNIDKKSEKKKSKKKDKKKGKGKIIASIIFLLFIGAIVAIFGFNVANIRDEYVYPALRDVPVVGDWIPEAENEEKDEYSGLTREQLIVQNKKLESEKKALEEDKENLTKRISDNDKELTRLKEIEANQIKFQNEKEEFDRRIAENDLKAYSDYYESIYPENADAIYREAVIQEAADKELKQYVQTFETMKKDAAAKVLEEMIGTDMDLVVRILNNINSEQRGAILGAMEPANAAAAAKQMAPDEQQ